MQWQISTLLNQATSGEIEEYPICHASVRTELLQYYTQDSLTSEVLLAMLLALHFKRKFSHDTAAFLQPTTRFLKNQEETHMGRAK